MLVSIIIPVYNSEKYLYACLESCERQSYVNLDIVIVNDGSTDSSCLIVEEFMKKDDRFRIINKKNEGLVEARKTGVREANADFIFFLDSDDIITNDAILLLVNEQKKENSDMVIANFWIETERGGVIGKTHNSFKYGKNREGMYYNLLYKTFGPTIWGKLIRKNIFEETNTPSSITIGEDVVTNVQIIDKGNVKYSSIDECIYHYIQRDSSMVNAHSVKTATARLLYLQWINNFLPSRQILCGDYEKAYNCFILGEYFSFLKDGGVPAMCADLSNLIYNKYMKQSVSLSQLGFFRFYFIYVFGISENLGSLYRAIYLLSRKFYYRLLR